MLGRTGAVLCGLASLATCSRIDCYAPAKAAAQAAVLKLVSDHRNLAFQRVFVAENTPQSGFTVCGYYWPQDVHKGPRRFWQYYAVFDSGDDTRPIRTRVFDSNESGPVGHWINACEGSGDL